MVEKKYKTALRIEKGRKRQKSTRKVEIKGLYDSISDAFNAEDDLISNGEIELEKGERVLYSIVSQIWVEQADENT